MKQKNVYRFRQYRIIEYENGLLWWETHYDFGMQRGGECFIYGNILIIGPWREEKDGSLIGESLDALKKLPPWDRTLYSCQASELLDSTTGRRLTDNFLKRMSLLEDTPQKGQNALKDLRPGLFRIDRYRISINDDHTISWQTPGGMNRIIGGRCFIESNILFLGPEVGGELKQDKQEFLKNLSQLPQWNGTMAWCRHSVLRSCQEHQPTRFVTKISTKPEESNKPEELDHFDNPTIINPNQKDQPSRKLPSMESTSPKPSPSFLPLSIIGKWPKFLWPLSFGKKFWITGLCLFILSGLIIGLILSLHSLEERFHWPKWFKENHHEHRHEHHSGSNPLIFSFLLGLILSLALSLTHTVQAEERDIVLEESGIHYPGGFDPNTVGEIQGKAFNFSRPERGPVRFQLSTDRGTYTILTSPPWYWNEFRGKIHEGTEVTVRGSKSFGRDGNLYVIAQEVQIISSGQSLLFRGKDGTPLWKASGWSGRGSSGGFGVGGAGGHGRR